MVLLRPNALAITSVFQNTNTRRDSGRRLGGQCHDFTWGDFVAHPELFESDTQDFQGAMTHEFGHVIGLDHTCFSPGATFADGKPIPRPMDNHGNPVPDCSAGNLPSITQATMYVSVSTPSAEVALRSLSPDDMQGACDIYPYTTNFVCLAPTGFGTTGWLFLRGDIGTGLYWLRPAAARDGSPDPTSALAARGASRNSNGSGCPTARTTGMACGAWSLA